MLHILLLVLKIVGIILLAILAILLVALLIVLFVPIRYRFYFNKPSGDDNFTAKANVSFLLHIFSVWIMYDKKIDTAIKVFGFNISRFLNRKKDISQDKDKKAKEAAVKDSKVVEAEPEKIEYSIDWNEETVDEEEADSLIVENEICDSQESGEALGEEYDDDIPNKFSDKVRVFLEKLATIPEKIFSFLDNLENKTDNLVLSVEKFSKKISYYDRLINDYRNRKAFDLGIKEVKRIVRHLLPKKISGKIRMGFEDPATLGSVLMYIGMLSPILPRRLEFVPIYDEEVIDGNIYVKGSFNIFIFVATAFKLYFNKDVRRLYRIIKRKK